MPNQERGKRLVSQAEGKTRTQTLREFGHNFTAQFCLFFLTIFNVNEGFLFSRESTEVEAAVSIKFIKTDISCMVDLLEFPLDLFHVGDVCYFVVKLQEADRTIVLFLLPCVTLHFPLFSPPSRFSPVCFVHLLIHSFVSLFVRTEHCQWCSSRIFWLHRHPECCKEARKLTPASHHAVTVYMYMLITFWYAFQNYWKYPQKAFPVNTKIHI